MAFKTANVTARIEPEIKEEAESILAKLGIPIAVLIDTLYRQIIMTGGIPFSLTVPRPKTYDSRNGKEFDAMTQRRNDGAKAEQSSDSV